MPDGTLSCTLFGIGIGVAVEVVAGELVDGDVGAADARALREGTALASDGGALVAVEAGAGAVHAVKKISAMKMSRTRSC